MHTIEEILTEYGPAMKRLAASYMPHGAAREDLEQDIFLAIYRGLGAFRGASSMRTYVYRIAHRCGMRARVRLDPPVEAVWEHVAPDEGHDPERLSMALERRERLARALRELPLAQRQPLQMRLDGLSYVEIAEVLDLDLHNVTSRIHRGTCALKTMMREESQDDA